MDIRRSRGAVNLTTQRLVVPMDCGDAISYVLGKIRFHAAPGILSFRRRRIAQACVYYGRRWSDRW
jgi:hypothetical protein